MYEGMFLVDSALASSNWDGVNNTIKTILEKSEAEIVSIKKWDDRKLAYEIKGKSRGTYILCYFRVDGGKIKDIEKAVQLSEQIIRVLILNAEQMTPEDMNKETPAAEAEREKDPDEGIQNVEEEQPDDNQQDNPEEDSEPMDEIEQDIIEDEYEPEPRE
jgi:small subunit ribosomal protein S6